MSQYKRLCEAWLIKREWQTAAHMATIENRCWMWLDSHAMNGR